MSAKIIPFPLPLTARDKARIRHQAEYELRVELSSDIREIPKSEFARIREEHEEAVLRQAVLAKFDTF